MHAGLGGCASGDLIEYLAGTDKGPLAGAAE
jgi:hypothetical protein